MSTRHSWRPILLASLLVCALILLAFLQYRWSGQVTEAERLRMHSSLQIAVDQFRQEFARNLLAAGSGLQADPDAAAIRNWDAVATAQVEWLATAPASRLVSAVYLWDADSKLLRLSTLENRYVETPVPAELSTVIARFTENPGERRPGPPRGSAWMLESSTPALVHALSAGQPPTGRPEGGLPPERRVGVQIVALNLEYLVKNVLPDLAARHFGGPDGLIYQVQIYSSSAPATLLFNSAGHAGIKREEADLDAELIDMRPRGIFDRGPQRERPRFGFRNWRRDGGGRPPDFQRASGAALLLTDGPSPWRVAVRHKSGSVAAAVETLRWRNLSVTFAVLLVLGISMVTLVRSTQRAQRLAELQVAFVAGVSHELRTPLAVISSAAENLTDGVVEDAEQVRQYGALIRDESRRLAGMMEQVLQFAADQKRRPYKPELLTVEELVEAALHVSQAALSAGGFAVERRVDANLPAIRGERGALTQCLQNLIANAAKYSGSSRSIAIDARASGTEVQIIVEDHGIGIEPEDLPHLFEAFYRAKAVRSAQIHGNGLGLNLAQSFARDAKGEITIESTPGLGSRFTLHLPAVLDPAAEPAPGLLNEPA